MPILKAGGKLVYFAHVPRCAGTAVSSYLTKRFGSVAFLDEDHLRPDIDPWSKTSPQHIATEDLYRLFPSDFFDHSFSVVRNPLSRMISEFNYLKIGGVPEHFRVPESQSFSEWIATLPAQYGKDSFALDNHLRPMPEMVPAGATVFRLEDGLDGVVEFLDRLTGDTNGPRHIVQVRAAKQGRRPTVA